MRSVEGRPQGVDFEADGRGLRARGVGFLANRLGLRASLFCVRARGAGFRVGGVGVGARGLDLLARVVQRGVERVLLRGARRQLGGPLLQFLADAFDDFLRFVARAHSRVLSLLGRRGGEPLDEGGRSDFAKLGNPSALAVISSGYCTSPPPKIGGLRRNCRL